MTQSAGIDYGRGLVNVDHSTGIRYGVIHHSMIGQSWYDESEGDYGEPSCPDCGGMILDCEDVYRCDVCGAVYDDSEQLYPESPIAWYYNDEGYTMEQSGDDCDIFVTCSPYFTFCALCSPCAPGAGYIMTQLSPDSGIRAYCPGPEWFEDGAPFRVYSVESEEEYNE